MWRQKPIPPRPGVMPRVARSVPARPGTGSCAVGERRLVEARAYASPEALRDTSSMAAHDGWHPRRPGAARRQRTVADVADRGFVLLRGVYMWLCEQNGSGRTVSVRT